MIIIPKVGDFVILVGVRPKGWNSSGKMDKYLNKTVEVTYVHAYTDGSGDGSFNFKENNEGWNFQCNNIASMGKPIPNDNYSII